MVVSGDNNRLFIERKDRTAQLKKKEELKKEQLFPEGCDLFFRKGVEGRVLFHYDANGKVNNLIDRRNNEDVVWRKIK